MITIVSKRHPFKFYLTIILGTLVFFCAATFLIFSFKNLAENGVLKDKDKLMPLFSIACYAMAGYTLYRYIKSAPAITLNKSSITFNSQTFSITDIAKVELTGKQPFKYIVNFPMEAATLTFINGETKYIFDDMYANSWEIKSFLKQVAIDKKDFVPGNNSLIDQDAVAHDCYETFKGNQLTSMRGISLWGFIVFLAFILVDNIKTNNVGLTVGIFCYSAFWFIVHSYLMNYFQVSGNFLVVRNHNFFWKKKAYNIRDIKEVVFETRNKMPNCLRVITKDFRYKLYPAATLRDKTWLDLKERLESYGIEVRNECI